MPAELRRAVILRRGDADTEFLDQIVRQHSLDIVYTAVSDTDSVRVAVMIAVQHLLDHRAEVVVVPHLTAEDIWKNREWRALAEFVDVVSADGVMLGGHTDFARP